MKIRRSVATASALLVAVLSGCTSTPHTDLEVRAPGLLGDAQLSGLTAWNDILILAPQVEPRLFWVPLSAIALAVESDADFGLLLEAEWLSGTLPPLGDKAGWEAVTVGLHDGRETLFLAYKSADGRHAVYAAPISLTDQGVEIGTLRRYAGLPPTKNPNHGYEALVAMGEDTLVALPEFTDEDAVVLRRGRSVPRFSTMPVEPHGYRIADAAALQGSRTRVLATSFCGRGDKPRCTAGDDSAALHLLCLDIGRETVTVVDAIPLPVATPGGNREYNAEGLAVHGSGIVMANDNLPGGADTTLRYDDSPKVRAFVSGCLDASAS